MVIIMNELVAALLLKKYGSGGGGSTPTGEINITDDGTYNVTDKASAVVRNALLKRSIDANDDSALEAYVFADDITILRGNGFRYLKASSVSGNGVLRTNSGVFQSNSDVVTINLPNCTWLGESTIREMNALASVNLPKLKEFYNHNFKSCPLLQELYLPSVDNGTGTYCFNSCAILSKIVVPKLKEVNDNCFVALNSLVNLSLPSATKIKNGLKNCSALTNLFLPGSTMAAKSSSDALMSTPIWGGNGTIWVNDNLVNTYKSATNWIVLASYIKPISEYTGDFNYMEGVS